MSTRHQAAASITVMAVLVGCTVPARSGTPIPEPISLAPIPPPAVIATPAPPLWDTELRADLDVVIDGLPAVVGVAIASVGSSSVTTYGAWSDGPAWSTIKVPLVLASMAHPESFSGDLAESAITQSDNAAAEQVWSSLGASDVAADEVTSVLASGGDETTVVPSSRSRTEFSIYGQTQWSLDGQTVFGAHLPCLADGDRVLEMMGSVSSDQSWGLGQIPGSEFKGGWGPSAVTGGYLVRQFGLLGRSTAVSIAAEPDSGAFDDGTDALDTIARVIDSHREDLPVGQCLLDTLHDPDDADRSTP